MPCFQFGNSIIDYALEYQENKKDITIAMEWVNGVNVLVHELAHIKHSNHSNDFWKFVKSILPDYQERKEWLRVNGPKLTL